MAPPGVMNGKEPEQNYSGSENDIVNTREQIPDPENNHSSQDETGSDTQEPVKSPQECEQAERETKKKAAQEKAERKARVDAEYYARLKKVDDKFHGSSFVDKWKDLVMKEGRMKPPPKPKDPEVAKENDGKFCSNMSDNKRTEPLLRDESRKTANEDVKERHQIVSNDLTINPEIWGWQNMEMVSRVKYPQQLRNTVNRTPVPNFQPSLADKGAHENKTSGHDSQTSSASNSAEKNRFISSSESQKPSGRSARTSEGCNQELAAASPTAQAISPIPKAPRASWLTVVPEYDKFLTEPLTNPGDKKPDN
ncbi:hypothetical protein B7494_g7315 [Chlorociboria aeruginascens]|nr:hypothetical protein B7494_g7315 [Chlorociboria aeruginascens]